MARDLHVVMLPWSAFGHLIPFFQLSIALAKAGVKVSFISTPRNIQRLPKVPPTLATPIDLVALPLPVLDKQILPEGAEASVDIPSEKIPYLKIAYDLLQHPVKQFISDQRPDWIITDAISYWVVEVAQEKQIPVINFSVFPASTGAFFLQQYFPVADVQEGTKPSPESLSTPHEGGKFQSSVAYRRFEATDAYEGFYVPNASGVADNERLRRVLLASKALAIRTCPEYESDYLNKCKEIIGKPVIPIGLLLPEIPAEGRRITDKSWIENFEWLDGQNPKSVVFVGFGSECKLSKEQVHEIARGLELSGLPFLWALRKPDWATDDHDALPPGFSDRTRGRGVVCIGWAPQLEILGHPSIGGSLFHAGWGSIIETLQFGHCLVVLPLIIDQPLNARLLVEKGLAVEVERSDDGSFSGADVAKALRLAMVSEEGENLRVRAKEAAEVFGNRNLQHSCFNRFVEYLEKYGAATDQSQ
ncbi:PREDICTED: putative UDP-rhamnose:rhamnosyltransferase 1 [Theobroma cacao]|uniref:UDP-rhamnose:rhamnosyltransferase 1 n=1 Tax=Theobroma cacao TaxID=3641 RepID=A0AB32W197_THECC|nr:PREDICTED: putative UDP-rhamnose:rhamnosyltransferase 1 [Theobroma cacao]